MALKDDGVEQCLRSCGTIVRRYSVFFTVKLLVLLVVGQTVCGLTVLRSDSIIVHKAWVRHAPENLHAKFHLHRLSGSSAKSINHP